MGYFSKPKELTYEEMKEAMTARELANYTNRGYTGSNVPITNEELEREYEEGQRLRASPAFKTAAKAREERGKELYKRMIEARKFGRKSKKSKKRKSKRKSKKSKKSKKRKSKRSKRKSKKRMMMW
jgi:hypothetical protein